MGTQRLPKWQAALSDLVRLRMHQPFVFGINDCCLFASSCVEAVTGEDPASDVRGTYSTASGAAKVIRDLGGMLNIAETRFGDEIPPLMAQVGDVALVRFEDRDTLAVCMGGHLLAPGADGLVFIPSSEALRVWRCASN